MTSLKIGTRRSPLALAQAELVRGMLAAGGVESELVPMTTTGDEGGAVAADSPQGLKGLWIDSILEALEAGAIDLAVHSAKDLPADEEDGFTLAAVPEREDPADVLISRQNGPLAAGATIGTSALRRRAQLLAAIPGIRVADLRGNVGTRLRKLADGEVDAVVLAAAGLARLGVTPEHAKRLGLDEMVPAPGQGCLAIQCRADDETVLAVLGPLDHPASHAALDAERSLMWRLGGGCALPLGAHATVDGTAVRLAAIVATPDGDEVLRGEATASMPEEAASTVASSLIADGAELILARLRDG